MGMQYSVIKSKQPVKESNFDYAIQLGCNIIIKGSQLTHFPHAYIVSNKESNDPSKRATR